MQVDFDGALLAGGAHETDQHALILGPRLEGAVKAEPAHVELVRKVDRNFRLIGDRMHPVSFRCGALGGEKTAIRLGSR